MSFKCVIGPEERIEDCLVEILKKADHGWIAVAWATAGPHLRNLAMYPVKGDLKVFVGTNYYGSDPNALDTLFEIARPLYVNPKPNGPTFHPKVYFFKVGKSYELLVGSVNLTHAAFCKNHEFTAHFHLTHELAIPIIGYFEKLERSLIKADKKWLSSYRKRHTILKLTYERLRKQLKGSERSLLVEFPESSRKSAPVGELGRILHLKWSDYLVELKKGASARNLPLLTNENPWLRTLSIVQPLLAIPFDRLNRSEFNKVLGEKGKTSLTGWFGAVTAGGNPYRELYSNNMLRRNITKLLPRVINAKEIDEAIVEAGNLFNAMSSIEGIGIGAISRLLCISRPSLFISVNTGSRKCLTKIFRTSANNLSTWEGYSDAVGAICRTSWYTSPRPSGIEGKIWDARAAFVDALAYSQTDAMKNY